ncbi:MAG TPA: hypothetical protein VNN55_11045 [bacterium]|nr:hypothetical protein [bacterium]
MSDPQGYRAERRETALLVLVAILATFIPQRLYLHLVNPHADAFLFGYNIHHLFTGAAIEIPAAIVLALRLGSRWTRRVAALAFGAGTAMVLDEVIFLITTDGSNMAYLTPISLWGAVVLVGLAVAGLVIVLSLSRTQP